MSSFAPIIPRSISPRKVLCGFTTRAGGVSSEPFNTLNLGFGTSDDRSNVLGNHRIVYRYADIDESRVALMGQVHGSGVRVVHSGGVLERTDGLITANTGVMLGVLVADCIPLLMYDSGHDIIGAVHCGWRPIVNGIAEKTLEIMAGHFATVPEAVITVLGPSAGPCCYEIGNDVSRHLSPGSIRKDNGRIFADLRAELCGRLVDAGVHERNIERFDDCTICNKSLYFSWRRDGNQSGRMMGYIMLVK